jgi:hypothetical protein
MVRRPENRWPRPGTRDGLPAITTSEISEAGEAGGLSERALALAYRAAYDSQLRARVAPGSATYRSVETVGPVVRKVYESGHGFIGYQNLGGLDGPALDSFIAAQRDHFTALGLEVEWKHHSHDLPADLPERLRAAGFVPEEPETVLIGDAAPLAAPPELPDGVRLREITSRTDLERVRALQRANR